MKMAVNSGSWTSYWDSATLFYPILEKTSHRFYEKTAELVGYSRTDTILDFGCGPGFLAGHLAAVAGEVYGVDTSGTMIRSCRSQFGYLQNVHFFHLDPDNYTDLSILADRKFSIIICLSVLHYMDSLEKVEEFLHALKEIAAPGAKLLLADIPVKSTPVLDAIDLLRASIEGKFLTPAVWFLARLVFTGYSRTRTSRSLLVIPAPQLLAMTRKLSLQAAIIEDRLTFSRRRLHLLITNDQ